MNKEKYAAYLKSEHWQIAKSHALSRAGNKCALCGSATTETQGVTLHVHHNTYDTLGNEDPTDMIVLCETCHRNYHDSGPTCIPKECCAILEDFYFVMNSVDSLPDVDLGYVVAISAAIKDVAATRLSELKWSPGGSEVTS